ncbi:hypothetical protein J4409_01460 [Candidatus Woesearchaeota archaeon]|nr:hypothetical protein [Candidatus Woesearchaeota archaeon]
MKGNIRIAFSDGTKQIKLNLPPRAELLEKSLRILYQDEEYEVEHCSYPLRLSKHLLNKSDFKCEFDKLRNQFDDYYFQSCKFANQITVLSDSNKFIQEQSLNRKEWARLLTFAFSEINVKGVESLIIHVAGGISDENKSKIIDDIEQSFSCIPVKKYHSQTENKFTLVEIIFFGFDIKTSEEF